MADPITRLNAALQGRYRIESELGEGGMATVYLADDLKHERKVALKVLKPELAAVVGAERFLAEIKTTANLQHPHILPLHDSGEAAGFLYYVMPYIEGETLRDRLEREKQLPVDEAVRIATDVAEALHSAHEQGVIHRDVKPANILLSKGRPLVADFGIALAVAQAGGGRLTETGLSMGTPFYMSPEQASADREPSAASDVYSLGCVLYEMLVGDPPYTASSAQAVLAKILTEDARAPTFVRSSIPLNVDAAIRKALEKIPADRFTDAQELGKALTDSGFRHGEEAAAELASGGSPWNRLTVAIASVAALLAFALGWSLLRPQPAPPAPERLSLVLPADRPVSLGWDPGRSLAISPNGMDVVYVAEYPDEGSSSVWGLVARSLGSRAVRDLPGTEGAAQPFFSPDGLWVGFFTDDPGELKKVRLDGGSPLTVVTGINGGSWADGTWTENDEILFATVDSLGLRRVLADGGSPQRITTIDVGQGERYHGLPESIPGTRTVLFTVWMQNSDDDHIEAVNLDTGDRSVVVEGGTQALYLESGHLLFRRDQQLVAAPFDAEGLSLTGPAVPIAEQIRTETPSLDGTTLQVAASAGGTLAYLPHARGTTSSLGVVGRDGAFEAFGQPLGSPMWVMPRVSPDGRIVAFIDGPMTGPQLYLHDVTRGSTERLAWGPFTDGVAWRPNGTELAVAGRSEAGRGLFLTDLSGTERIIAPSEAWDYRRNASWSPDGAELAYTVQVGTQHDIWVVSPDDSTSAKPLITGPAAEHSPRFSPDGGWLAFESDESGQDEVYVRRYPQGERLRVSTDGGGNPVWSVDGSELFFMDDYEGAGWLMVVSVTPAGETLRLGTPTPLLEWELRGPDGRSFEYHLGSNGGPSYDVFPDGRFVMVRTPVAPVLEVILVQNFFEELKRLLPN